jgi:hypothetical protein
VTTGPERCRAVSLGLGEPLGGTASVVRAWLLLEQPGPWGREALTTSRLPTGLGPSLARVAADLRIRPLLIRRHGRRSTVGGVRCVLAWTGGRRPWIEHALIDDPHEVLDLDLEQLARGEPGILRPVDGPVFVVCTHGRHDPCCAENGRPVARALSAHYPARTWESSHLGGDRFAANLVAFPHGLYFGRVNPEQAPHIAAAYRKGTIDLAHYRGRSCYPFAVQTAEVWLREKTALTAIEAVTLAGTRRDGDIVVARFRTSEPATWTVHVRPRRLEIARPLTCHDARASQPVQYEIVAAEAEHQPA